VVSLTNDGEIADVATAWYLAKYSTKSTVKPKARAGYRHDIVPHFGHMRFAALRSATISRLYQPLAGKTVPVTWPDSAVTRRSWAAGEDGLAAIGEAVIAYRQLTAAQPNALRPTWPRR
jgi:hypothetical protein